MTQVLTIPASEVRPFDGISHPAITVSSSLARLVAVDVGGGQHVHDIEHDIVDERTFEPAQTVRVARPAVVAPCTCGYSADSDSASSAPDGER